MRIEASVSRDYEGIIDLDLATDPYERNWHENKIRISLPQACVPSSINPHGSTCADIELFIQIGQLQKLFDQAKKMHLIK